MENNTDRKSSLFIGDRERVFMQRTATEAIELVTQQKIRYYSIDAGKTKTDDLYNESIGEKIFYQPIETYCLILYNQPVVTTGNFSSETQYSLKIYIQKFRVEQDFNLSPTMGDFVEFGQKYFEVTRVFEPQLIAGQDVSGFKMGVYLDCISTRADVFSPNRNSVHDQSFNSDVIR